MTTRDFLKDARIHMNISHVFAWLWMLGWTVGGIRAIGALFAGWSWLAAIGLIAGGMFCGAVAKSYRRAAGETVEEGLRIGALSRDVGGKIVPANDARAA